MTIQSVQVELNGTWYTLALNSGSGNYEGTFNAPGQTSYQQPNHVYNMQVKATNTAGTVATVDGDVFSSLHLRVLERLAPTVTITSPGQGAYVGNAQQPILFQLRDEAGGSGINLAALSLTIDSGEAVGSDSPGMVCSAVANGYDCTYTPQVALADGLHTVTINVSDHDGNAAPAASRSYTQDTVPPVLNVSSPADGFLVNQAALVLTGSTNDAVSSPVAVSVSLNGNDQGSVTVEADGSFSKSLVLTEGENIIIVTATDSAGKSSSVTVTGTLDTSTPEITAVEVLPNPVDAGATMVVKVTVSG